MTDEREELPTLDFKNMQVTYPTEEGNEKTIEILLETPNPIKEGQSRYGLWHLWIGHVENAPVVWGRGKEKRSETGYTGKAFLFPTDRLNEELMKLADGKNNVKVRVKKVLEQRERGFIQFYNAEKLSDGEDKSTLTQTEQRIVDDTTKFKNEGHFLTETDFITLSGEPQYEGKISKERAKELYKRVF